MRLICVENNFFHTTGAFKKLYPNQLFYFGTVMLRKSSFNFCFDEMLAGNKVVQVVGHETYCKNYMI